MEQSNGCAGAIPALSVPLEQPLQGDLGGVRADSAGIVTLLYEQCRPSGWLPTRSNSLSLSLNEPYQ